MNRLPATSLLALLLGCGSVVTEQALTGGTGGSIASSSGTGGVTTASSSSGTGGTGGVCTGTCPSCTPFAPWSKMIDEPVDDGALAGSRITMPDGSMILPADQALVKIDRDGQVLWKIDAGHVRGVVTDDACGMFVMGTASHDDTALFGQPVSCPAESCTYLGRLDADGAALWLRILDPGLISWPLYLAAGGDRLVAAGSFQGTLDLGTGPIESLPGEHTDLFVATFSADDGHTLWTRMVRFPDNMVNHVGGIAMSSAGDVVLTEQFQKSIDFGDGVIPEPVEYQGTRCRYVASYDASGSLHFGKFFGAPGALLGLPGPPAIDAAGDIVIAESIQGMADFGGGLIGGDESHHVMLVKLNAEGDHVFSEVIATVKGLHSAVAVDAQKRIGVFTDDAVIVLDAAGSILAKHPVVASAPTKLLSIGFGLDGALTIAGKTSGTIDLGQGPLDPGGKGDVFAGAFALSPP